jgi:hypothetical protein
VERKKRREEKEEEGEEKQERKLKVQRWRERRVHLKWSR